MTMIVAVVKMRGLFEILDSLLIQQQSEITPKWYQFGEAIGIEKKVVDKYKHYSPEQSIVEILDNWLRNHAEQPI